MQQHDELLDIWRSSGATGLSVLHVDFHDDMRNFVIDRKRRVLYRSGIFRSQQAPTDEGNFLGVAVVERIVRKIHWVHGLVGGRLYDSDVVKYSTDWSAIPHRMSRCLRNARAYPLEFEASTHDDWRCSSGPIDLSLDWDFFAAYQIEPHDYLKMFNELLAKIEGAHIDRICFCYSPKYVLPTVGEFKSAIDRLVEIYRCEVFWPNGKFLNEVPTEATRRGTDREGVKWRTIRELRRKGIY